MALTGWVRKQGNAPQTLSDSYIQRYVQLVLNKHNDMYSLDFLWTISNSLWRLEGHCINILAVVFEKVNIFFFNLVAGKVNGALNEAY